MCHCGLIYYPQLVDILSGRSGIWYVGSPYTKYHLGLPAAWSGVAYFAAALTRDTGLTLYSPIVHSHPLAFIGNINPLDGEFWLRLQRPMADAATGLIVYRMTGWQESVGLAKEIEWFESANKPILSVYALEGSEA